MPEPMPKPHPDCRCISIAGDISSILCPVHKDPYDTPERRTAEADERYRAYLAERK